jgi:hypothetical protein
MTAAPTATALIRERSVDGLHGIELRC